MKRSEPLPKRAATKFDPARLSRVDAALAAYVDDGRLPGWVLLVSQDGREVHRSMYGWRDVEAHEPMTMDTVFRIYSMTKPVTAVAAMMLYEEGAFELTDPVSRFIPAFAHSDVYSGASGDVLDVTPAVGPMRIWHLLTHTAGLAYGAPGPHPVDRRYRSEGFELDQFIRGVDLATNCDRWARLPLLFEPGTGWSYSVSSDVLGRVVEVASGQPLDAFMRDRIFEPLGLATTAFSAEGDAVNRLAALYASLGENRIARADDLGAAARQAPRCLSGGAGLVSTVDDYHRFALMLLGEGTVDDVHLLSAPTVRLMASNHLPGGVDVESIAHPLFRPGYFDGIGYGLGLAVVTDPVAAKSLSSPGELSWGGAASTLFWVDPIHRVVATFMTQVRPSSTYPLRGLLRQLIYQALVTDTGGDHVD